MPSRHENERERRVLYVAVSQGHLSVFHNPYIEWFRDRGYKVDIAARAVDGFPLAQHDYFHEIDFARSPFSIDNIRGFFRLVRILRAESYTMVHTHTPVPSALTRLAALFAKGRPTVVYTAHGFHFFPRAPVANWLTWFSLEWLFTRMTDIVVTINNWDFDAAQRLLRAQRARLIPGIGVNLDRFRRFPASRRAEIRRELGIKDDAFVMLYIAEFIPRKNHAFLIDAFAEIRRNLIHAELVLVGDGPLQDVVAARVAQLGLQRVVKLLGFRRDIPEIANSADLAVSSSVHEGLPIGLAESMACGLPVVASEDRGHIELVLEGETGFLFEQNNAAAFVAHVLHLAGDPALRRRFGEAGQNHVRKFEIESAMAAMEPIYREAEALFEQRGRSG